MTNSLLDAYVEVVAGLLRSNKTNPEVVTVLREQYDIETSESSIRRLIGRTPLLKNLAELRRLHNEVNDAAESYRFETADDDTINVTLPPEDPSSPKFMTVEDVMQRHKLDPAEWEASHVLPNAWEGQRAGGTKITFHQFKFTLKRKTPLDLIFPAQFPTVLPPAPKPYSKIGSSFLCVGFFDPHLPYIDGGLRELALRWLAHNRPERGVFGGDQEDLPNLSRHPASLVFNASGQECTQATFDWLLDVRNASSDTSWDYIEGNHDKRYQKALLEKVPEIAALTAAQWPESLPAQDVIYSPRHRLHLDALNINYVGGPLDYEHYQVKITDGLSARHGTFHGKDALQKTAEKYNHDVVYGHLHRHAIFTETRRDSYHGTSKTVQIIQAPTMARVDVGYDTATNWTQGFVVFEVFSPGLYHVDFALYRDGVLTWRDQQYSL